MLFQIEKPDDFCLELKRILKPGGKVLVVDWSEASTMSPANLVSASKAQALFEKSGFKFVDSFNAGDHHYGLIFTR